ncbi:CdaR family protein [Clostridium felsineum]|uniref:CdaA regulatory protein CdaR n=1 Tax=Clostridium felsineum TaxID=36839 RepID=A0A1S8KY07_9CLOT|nr:CdaR family protein [Clostridium felsineum]URZ08155.1 CdaA regulatory protein CdaR [Clostridium felsineum]URZ13186.1 CdaA regulatory protein CdaR [Clostridium felsineum]
MEKKTKREIIVRIACFIAAFCLWLYITNYQNPIKTYKIKNIPVTINNIDSLKDNNLTLAPNQKFEISVTIKGNATDVYKVKQSEFKIVADIASYAVKKGDNKIPVQIVKSPNNISIVQEDNMWVSVKIDKIDKKDVSVDIKKQGKNAYTVGLYDAFSTPSKVSVSGASELVSMVDHVEGIVDIKSDEADSFESKVKLEAVDAKGAVIGGVALDTKEVNVTLTKKKKIKNVSINVKTTGQSPSGVKVKTITPAADSVQIEGVSEGVKNINSLDTEPIDLSKISAGQTVKVRLLVPDGVRIVNSDDSINVKVDTDTTIQKTFKVNITTSNLGQNLKVQLSNEVLNIVVSGYVTDINNIKDGDIKANIDLTNLAEGTYTEGVNVTLPSGISKVSQDLDKVNVTITK